MDGAVSLLSLFSTLLALSASAAADVCFWSGTCSNRWVGGCGAGRAKAEQSDDCHGLCASPRYPPCGPFHTHLLCCNEETPIPSDECARCGNRMEVGDHWMCCSDGTQAQVINQELRTGFCRSGAQLAIQPKQREVFKWMPREWSECSARCGVKRRVVHCVGMLVHSPKQRYYVNETKCDTSRMPHHEEPCGAKSCSYEGREEMHHLGEMRHHRKHRFPIWAKLIIFGLSSVVTAGLSVGGFILYQRWKERNSNHGFVYVMLDNYS